MRYEYENKYGYKNIILDDSQTNEKPQKVKSSDIKKLNNIITFILCCTKQETTSGSLQSL